MADLREDILARFATSGTQVSGVVSAGRNGIALSETARPAIIVLDADEAADEQDDAGNRHHADGPRTRGMRRHHVGQHRGSEHDHPDRRPVRPGSLAQATGVEPRSVRAMPDTVEEASEAAAYGDRSRLVAADPRDERHGEGEHQDSPEGEPDEVGEVVIDGGGGVGGHLVGGHRVEVQGAEDVEYQPEQEHGDRHGQRRPHQRTAA